MLHDFLKKHSSHFFDILSRLAKSYRTGVVSLIAFVQNSTAANWIAERFSLAWWKRAVLNKPPDKPFDQVHQVGAVVKEVEPGQRHIGFLYRLGNDPPKIVHLAWHHMLLHEEPTPDYCWVQCGLDERSRNVIAPVIAEVAVQQKLPYSPVYEGVYFEEGSLRYNRTAPGDGLTCATFMMAILDRLGFPLFQTQQWVARPADAAWAERIIQRLERSSRVLPEHTAAIRARPQGARFRPEEVAGSMTETAFPVPFLRAQALGLQVLDELAACN